MPIPSTNGRKVAMFRASKGGGGGVGRLIFVNNTSLNDNHYVVGANVGAQSVAVRRALQRRASNNAQGQPCCMNNSQ